LISPDFSLNTHQKRAEGFDVALVHFFIRVATPADNHMACEEAICRRGISTTAL
jgi:hypothetical protein